jgi:hypothetical protein
MGDLKAGGFNCRNCGAPVTLRGLSWTQTVTCPSCDAIQDPNDPNLLVLQEAARRERVKPLIPLGTRGTLGGRTYEAIGFQHRTIQVDDETYGWSEYLLFNPYHGFRYLSEYQGHWNVIRTLHALPEMHAGQRGNASYGGRTFRHFQSSTATTAYIIGEFPWEARSGDRVSFSDYVAPPQLLSAEREIDDTTWSLGQYTTGAEIWRAFSLPGSPPAAQGVFANQPNPHAGRPSRFWKVFLALAALLVLLVGWRAIGSDGEAVFNYGNTFTPGPGEASLVTPEFDLATGPTNLEVDIETDLANNWAYFNLALIEARTGEAFDFGEEVGYYFGSDGDGNWTEGSKRGEVMLAQVPAGRYYLRVEPEGDGAQRAPVHYTIRVIRDVPTLWPYVVALLLLVIPPIWVTLRSMGFEGKRWSESDDSDGGE